MLSDNSVRIYFYHRISKSMQFKQINLPFTHSWERGKIINEGRKNSFTPLCYQFNFEGRGMAIRNYFYIELCSWITKNIFLMVWLAEVHKLFERSLKFYFFAWHVNDVRKINDGNLRKCNTPWVKKISASFFACFWHFSQKSFIRRVRSNIFC